MNKNDFELLIATKNQGKVEELERLLEGLPVRLRSLREFPEIAEPEETGESFSENAVLKARYYARRTGLTALADDSGLEVAALAGAPGIFSARYGGEKATDADRYGKLLNELDGVPEEKRAARFVCAAALADRHGEIKYLTEGVCNGKISFNPGGTNGFGYDPVFIPDGFLETFGELPNEIKQQISHRALATKKIIAYLRGFTAA